MTLKSGSKGALAKWLKVPPPRVSEWLNGVYQPSAETTLRLLEWVTAQEAKQKTLGSVHSTAKGKQTRIRKTKYVKPNSSP